MILKKIQKPKKSKSHQISNKKLKKTTKICNIKKSKTEKSKDEELNFTNKKITQINIKRIPKFSKKPFFSTKSKMFNIYFFAINKCKYISFAICDK